MERRNFLKISALSLPVSTVFSRLQASGARALNGDQTLVLLELKGGNDGLNMVVPYGDGSYYDIRGSFGIQEETLLHLNNQLGLHPSLELLRETWDQGELAIILGLGYPEANRSHFRSIEIWDSASDSNQYLSEGWVSQLLTGQVIPDSVWVEGLVIGGGSMGPLSGTQLRTLSLNSVDSFLSGAREIPAVVDNPELGLVNHVIQVQNAVFDSVGTLESAMAQGNVPSTEFPNTPIGQSLKELALLLANGLQIPAVKVSHGSFDTHTQQAVTQSNLFSQLAEALSAFKSAMLEIGKWDKVAIQTYSEFGRRVEGNASGGTDHGTAAPHFLLGGAVSGGIFGEQPSLTKLDSNGDLQFTTDFRNLYASLAAGLWNIENPFNGSFGKLSLFK